LRSTHPTSNRSGDFFPGPQIGLRPEQGAILLDPIDHLEDPAEQRPNLAADSFAGRTVLVVGGGGSIGAACAWLAARLGAQVVVAGRKPEKLQAVVKAMGERGLCAAGVPVDIRDRASVESLFDELAKRALPDLVVQSAGGQYPSAAIDIVEKGWKAVVDTNLTGSFNVMQCAAQRWRDAGRGGSLVNIVVSPRGLHGVAHTVAARAGVVAFSEAAAVEWAPLGIRVNCIAPGVIVSAGWSVYRPEVRALYRNANPMREAGTPWQIAEAALFVGGPAGGFITGETLEVSGGGPLWGEGWTVPKPDWFREATRALDAAGEGDPS
jgi:citronellol/citronellal dehydrogenase